MQPLAALARGLRHYLLALQFFTRVPVTGRLADWVGFSPQMLRASAAHFPGIGVLVGASAAVLHLALLWALPVNPYSALLAALLSTAFTVLLTGGFHEDGLADVADGLGGSQQRARALEIMKDSRIGAFGALALLLALLTKVVLLAALAQVSWSLAGWALWLGHGISRVWPLALIRALPHVGDAAGSKSKPLADQVSIGALAVAALWCALLLAAAGAALGAGAVLWPLLSAGLTAALLGRWFWRRLGGFTGDCLGATQQGCELTVYLTLLLLPWH